MKENILDTFCARQGLIAFVGAGGKKSSIFRIASAHPGRVAITSTVYTPPFRRRLNAYHVVAEPDQLFACLEKVVKKQDRIAYAHPSDKPARLKGVSTYDISRIHEHFGFDVTFVKADGARLRWIKAPNRDEPVLPEKCSVLVSVTSIRALGKPLSEEVAHRAQATADIMGIELGQRITATHFARLISSECGGLKNAAAATVIAVINMVEDREELRVAKLIAEQAIERTKKIDRVVIASMIREAPVLEVVHQK